MSETYKIIRFYQDEKEPQAETIKSGLMYQEAIAYVREGHRGTDKAGRPYFDGFASEEIE